MRTTFLTATIATFALAACGAPESEDTASDDMAADDAMMVEADSAATMLMDAEGNEVGRVIAERAGEGVALTIMVEGLAPGAHGAHVHDTGSCEPDFMAAGPHWGPFDAELNLADEDDSNDSENAMIMVGEDGTGSLEYTLDGEVTFDAMLEGDGSAFVIHQRSEDPMMETPSGNGDRIACGVFQPSPHS